MTEPTHPQLDPLDRPALIAEVRALFLDRVEKAVRIAGVSVPASIEALRTGSVQLLDQMTTEGARTGFALANSLTASQIRLVDDNQLELSIRLGDMSKRLRDECANVLYKFHQRFVTLLDRPTLRLADDPLSPEAVCRSLAEMFGAANAPHQQVLARLPEIEIQLTRELPLMYAELAELLVARHIEPAKIQTMTTPSPGGAARLGSASAGNTSNAMAELQQAVLARLLAAMPPGTVPAELAGQGAVAGTGDTGSRFEQVMTQLDQWQTQGQADLFSDSEPELRATALHGVKNEETMSRLRAQDTAALDVLASVFDAVFDDVRLSPALKAAVARLQIPVLKAAILSNTFFTDTEHPARQLLSALGEASIGLGPDVDVSHPVCVEFQKIAAAVQADFKRDTEVFARYASQLESFIARRNHELQGSAQVFIGLAKRQEAEDLAARQGWRLVASRTATGVPPTILNFLREHWTHVLAADWLAEPARGEAWLRDERVLDDLLWSIRPKDDPEQRKVLGQMVPDLLGRLRAGLDRIAVPAEVRKPFLEACFVLQTAALRGRTMEMASGQAVDVNALNNDRVIKQEDRGFVLKSVRPGNPDARASGEAVLELVIGDWVEFAMPDGSRCCGRLCWLSPELGNPLFLNSSWNCAISMARSSLERQFAAGEATAGERLSFFDNAIKKALNHNHGAIVR